MPCLLLFKRCPVVSVLICFLLVQIANGLGEITVCTYNLWNVMFSWEIRMRHIANMAREAECQVLVLQEVRLHADRSRSQADFLQRLLPEFRWGVTRLADHVTKPAHAYWSGWEMEGLAVLSKVPTGGVRVEKLSKVHGPDSNQRMVLHVPVLLDTLTTVHVLVVHLSYHRQQQCQNAAEILQYIDKNQLRQVVLAGDFNVYPDFPDPVRLLQNGGGGIGGENQCQVSLMSPLSPSTPTLQDSWVATHTHSPGFTFSNMPEPGLTSRPDRILTSRELRARQVWVQGEGGSYRGRHSWDIWVHRLYRVMRASREAFQSQRGYSCLHDCGPHGRCRCGVCVARGGEGGAPCLLPRCEECSPAVFLQLGLFFTVATGLFLLAGTAGVKILVVASHIDQTGASLLPGFACCLCNPAMVRRPTVTARHRAGRLLRFLGVGRLPPVYLLLVSLTLAVFLCSLASVVFQATLDTAGDVMEEEYFPSDHLMVAAKLEIQ